MSEKLMCTVQWKEAVNSFWRCTLQWCDICPSTGFDFILAVDILEGGSIVPLIPHPLFFSLLSLLLDEFGTALKIAAPQTLDCFYISEVDKVTLCVWLHNFSCCENFHPLTKSPSRSPCALPTLFSSDGPKSVPEMGNKWRHG